jgi:hypothetical protein
MAKRGVAGRADQRKKNDLQQSGVMKVIYDMAQQAAEKLENEGYDELADYVRQLKRERDAAVKDIRNAAWSCCHVCKHYYQPNPNVRIYSCKKHGDFDKHDFIADDGSIFCGAMEWRGVQGAGDENDA